jgi:hypothetical protein
MAHRGTTKLDSTPPRKKSRFSCFANRSVIGRNKCVRRGFHFLPFLHFAKQELDCFVARAPRNDGVKSPPPSARHCERSEAIQEPRSRTGLLPPSIFELLRTRSSQSTFLRAPYAETLDCFVARAPRNDGAKSPPPFPRHCERSEAIQEPRSKDWIASAFALRASADEVVAKHFLPCALRRNTGLLRRESSSQ